MSRPDRRQLPSSRLFHLAGLLWNCTDTLPGATCDDLELARGASYAQAARTVLQQAVLADV